MSPLSRSTFSLKFKTIFASTATPVALSAGTDELNIGSVKPKSNAVLKLYSYTYCSLAKPTIKSFVPTSLNSIPQGCEFCDCTLKSPKCEKPADKSKAVGTEYTEI